MNRHTFNQRQHLAPWRVNAWRLEHNALKSEKGRARRCRLYYRRWRTNIRENRRTKALKIMESTHIGPTTIGSWYKTRHAVEATMQAPPNFANKESWCACSEHTNFKVHTLHPIPPVPNGVESIIWLLDRESIIKRGGVLGLINIANMGDSLSEASLITIPFMALNIEWGHIWKVTVQLRRITTASMHPAFLPGTHKCITLAPWWALPIALQPRKDTWQRMIERQHGDKSLRYSSQLKTLGHLACCGAQPNLVS